MGSCEILQGSWKQIVIKFSQAGKSAAASWKKFVQMCQKVCTGYGTSQAHFRAVRRKSLCKSTENEEAGKVKSCADVQRNTRNVRVNVQKIVGN